METYSRAKWREAGLETVEFVQDNMSKSEKKGTLRGLHYQVGPNAQAKLIRVVTGAIQDIALDLRRHSPTFGKYFAVDLEEGTGDQFFIPAGFAHGFLTLRADTIIAYKVSAPYDPKAERGIVWSDPDLRIAWEGDIDPLALSERDKMWPGFKDAEYF